MEKRQEGINMKSIIDFLGMVGAVGTVASVIVGVVSWAYMQNKLNVASIKGIIDFNITDLTTVIFLSIPYRSMP